jgi:type IV pilus assembly protein PilM
LAGIRGEDMFSNDKIAVHINDSYVKIIEGNNKRVKHWDMSEISTDNMAGPDISHMDFIYSRLKRFIRQKKVKTDKIVFSISSPDIVTRHLEIPLMKKKSIKGSVEWEMNQYLPGMGENHYIDFQIINKIENEEKKVFKILAVAVPREKVDNIYNLSQRLNLKLKAVDISANCISRVFKQNAKETVESIGVIELGDKSSSIVILDNGNLFMEREVPFGTDAVAREIARRLQIYTDEAEHYLKEVFTFGASGEEVEVDNRIQTMFDNVFESFVKVIQFYTTGRVKKPLDEIYLTGSACYIHGLEDYVQNYFNSHACIVNSNLKLPAGMKLPEGFDLKLYLNAVGLLLRKE